MDAGWRYSLRKKRDLVLYKGGKCQVCGYDKLEYLRVFTFHHRDPREKKFNVNTRTKGTFEDAKKEADKCDLLCMNCHMELHDREIREKKPNYSYNKVNKPLLNINCKQCDTSFKPKNRLVKFCTKQCFINHYAKDPLKNISKEEFLKLKEKLPYSKLGPLLNSNDVTVKKYAIKRGYIDGTTAYKRRCLRPE